MQRTILLMDTLVLTRLERGTKEKLALFLQNRPEWFENRREGKGHVGEIKGQIMLDPNLWLYFVWHEEDQLLALYTETELEVSHDDDNFGPEIHHSSLDRPVTQ